MAVDPASILKIVSLSFSLINGPVNFAKMCGEISGAREEIEVAGEKMNLIRNSLEDVVKLLEQRDVKSDPDGSKYVHGVVESAAGTVQRSEEKIRNTKSLRWFLKDKKSFEGLCHSLDTARNELSEARQRLNGMALSPHPPPYEAIKSSGLESAGQSYRLPLSLRSVTLKQTLRDDKYRPHACQFSQTVVYTSSVPN